MEEKRFRPIQAIRRKCLDCCAYEKAEVKKCPAINCPLWRYRMGKEERDGIYYESRKKEGEQYEIH